MVCVCVGSLTVILADLRAVWGFDVRISVLLSWQEDTVDSHEHKAETSVVDFLVFAVHLSFLLALCAFLFPFATVRFS